MPQPVCFSDATYYDSRLYPDIVAAMQDYPDVCSIGLESFQFKVVGVLLVAESPIVIFPKNYDIVADANLQIQEARTLTRALLRYRNEVHHERDEISLLYGNDAAGSDRIVAAANLLEDFCLNGYVQRRIEKITQNCTGHTDWNLTINKTVPVFSKGAPAYILPVVHRRNIDEQNIVYLTHKYVISECFKEWGWLFDYDDYVESCVTLPCPIEELIDLLKNELRHTYLDREIYVIQNLIQYLSEKSGHEQRKKLDLLATPYFSFVWEAICAYLFDNKYSQLRTLLPQPEWESDFVRGNISQRPDIFMTGADALYILDAKYYNYNHNIPGWHDVVKQLFYRHTMMSIRETREYMRLLPFARNIYNAFIMPGSGTGLLYLGRVYVPSITDLGEIKAFAIDQRKALSAYAYRNSGAYMQTVRTELACAFC